MNRQTIKGIIDTLPSLSVEERKLLTEETFAANLCKVIARISNNDIEIAQDQTVILINSILRRHRMMVMLKAREVKQNPRILLQLLNQKMKDNFKSLDKNLSKYRLRNQLRRKTSKVNQTSVASSSKKASSRWFAVARRSGSSPGRWGFCTTASSIRTSFGILTRF